MNNDGRLSREEFATLVAAFAKAARVSTHELIDFMVVTSALKDNSRIEKAYIKSVRDRSSGDLSNAIGDSSSRCLGGLWKNLRS